MNKYLLASVIALCVSSGIAQAADGTITFNGLVTSSACTAIASVTADATGTPGTAVLTLDNVTGSTLNAAAGTYAGIKPFSIQLTGCEATAALRNVRTLFTTTSAVGGAIENTALVTPAANVAIAILQQNGTTQIDVNGGAASDPGVALPPTGSPRSLTLNYNAAYKSLSTGVTSGNVTGVADFVISYF
ncbi:MULTISPECIES: fimbrial protein [Citrobacter]|uniref:Fimbrial protein n=1 Tax=Citrobacter telavivensis TaxID=2653932 RepID=A0A6L5E2V9_9ENTR|nr:MULTISPECIES: fimbrial protein [Citrobacter]MPQ49829.1 fimbrial protein [Citrobacter telavivensis]QFS70579.1 fimbrial protein [Citrobacter telavivensis]CAI9387170.1 Laminin-binding fimbrial subunit ElfA [Citrobacter sp. T1.2D-1]